MSSLIIKIVCGAILLVIGGFFCVAGMGMFLAELRRIDLYFGVIGGLVSLAGLWLIVSGGRSLKRMTDPPEWEDEYW